LIDDVMIVMKKTARFCYIFIKIRYLLCIDHEKAENVIY